MDRVYLSLRRLWDLLAAGSDRMSGSVSSGEPTDVYSAEELLTAMYHELKSLARARLQGVAAHTLQPTALVHEAYLRLTRGAGGGDGAPAVWSGPGHFFGAAAEAMRQVLVDHARTKNAAKRGGGQRRVALCDEAVSKAAEAESEVEQVLLVSEAVDELAKEDPVLGEILKLRYFAGLSREEAAAALEIAPRTFDRRWRYIVAVLRERRARG